MKTKKGLKQTIDRGFGKWVGLFALVIMDMICFIRLSYIEKSHGMEELGAAELGAKHEAAAFKKIKPDVKVLFYFNAAYAWPYTSYNRDFTTQRIDAHPELKKFLLPHPKNRAAG